MTLAFGLIVWLFLQEIGTFIVDHRGLEFYRDNPVMIAVCVAVAIVGGLILHFAGDRLKFKYLTPAIESILGLFAVVFGSHLLYGILTVEEGRYVVLENAFGPSPKPELFAGGFIAGGLLLLVLGPITFKLESKKEKPTNKTIEATSTWRRFERVSSKLLIVDVGPFEGPPFVA